MNRLDVLVSLVRSVATPCGEAFSAASTEEQWAILRRYAVDQNEAASEDYNAAVDEGMAMDALIVEADRQLAPR